MREYEERAKFIFLAIFLCMLLAVGFLIKNLWSKNDILSNSYNPRIGKDNFLIERGKIFDSNGILLADNLDNGQRNYLYPEIFAHVIGYKNNGGAGIEKKYDFDLKHCDNEFVNVLDKIFSGKKLYGKDIYLTIDEKLQEFVYSKLKNKGAIIVMQPSSGKILAMVSKPSYNPNDMQNFAANDKNAPLLNRATQGLYPPGSVFKIITTMAAQRHINLNEFRYRCRGREKFDDDIIHCFNSHVHGSEDIKSAFAVSCNTFFATLGDILGNKNLLAQTRNFFMDRDFDFELEHNFCSIGLKEDSPRSELIQTSIGQGKTLVTPLYMAMITSAIANDGVMMRPHVTERIGNRYMQEKEIAQIMTKDQSDFMKDLMEEVVVSGTAKRVYVKGMDLAGKTGSAENSSGLDHGWFVVFSRDKNFAISILLENSGGSVKAVNLARQIINFIKSSG